MYEPGYRFLGGMKHQEQTWRCMLTALAVHYGVYGPKIEMRSELLDNYVQWSKAGNVWHNALIRTTLHLPVRLFHRVTGSAE